MIPANHLFWPLLAAALGACWGSFINVVAYRMPQGLSVVNPGSRCGNCERSIAWYHNIPVVSWLWLRGKCARCGQSFSIRYMMVEAALAVLAAALWLKLSAPHHMVLPEISQVGIAWGLSFTFVALLLTISLIDLDTMRIPDILSVPGIGLGILAAWLVPRITGVPMYESLLGMLIGGGTLLAITYGYFALTGREGMGLGDYRLMAMVGAFLGWRSLLFLLIASALQGLAFALIIKLFKLEDRLPDLDDEVPLDAVEDHGTVADGIDPDQLPDPVSAPDFRHMAIPFGPFIALSALEWLIFEEVWMNLFNRFVFSA
ncbi:MAG TPA: prepilin peptidase [Myxococcales bacterium]|nr:prepilin peptidase [Myxococcales bacterium]HIN86502.1 prepilin peptidase [Myxococcales bacterium]